MLFFVHIGYLTLAKMMTFKSKGKRKPNGTNNPGAGYDETQSDSLDGVRPDVERRLQRLGVDKLVFGDVVRCLVSQHHVRRPANTTYVVYLQVDKSYFVKLCFLLLIWQKTVLNC